MKWKDKLKPPLSNSNIYLYSPTHFTTFNSAQLNSIPLALDTLLSLSLLILDLLCAMLAIFKLKWKEEKKTSLCGTFIVNIFQLWLHLYC